jgi:mismatch-specific thymine-DNA glycosylase
LERIPAFCPKKLMQSHKCTIKIAEQWIDTLADILPSNNRKLKILFIAKVPTDKSVKAGHYFQGRQGKSFWNKLKQYNLLNVPENEFEDDYLLNHEYGITDIVKMPRNFGSEPSAEEYREGTTRILAIIQKHNPAILFFVYKKVLDEILNNAFNYPNKACYGFNPQYDACFNSKVFVFPMPGLKECTTKIIQHEMGALKSYLLK